MCLIILALEQHPRFPMILAANRDEFHARPTEAIHWWDDRRLLGGRDLESGGTWLGVTPDGRVAAVTNYRSGQNERAPRSRGELPLQVLDEPGRGDDMVREIRSRLPDFAGFNLLFSDGCGWFYTSNRDRAPWRRLYRGIFGLSNHLLQSPWPKVLRGTTELQRALGHQDATSLHTALLTMLHDDRQAAVGELPHTGVGVEMEKFLSPPFIRGANYGTRASTVVSRDLDGKIRVTEVSYGAYGEIGPTRNFQWAAADDNRNR